MSSSAGASDRSDDAAANDPRKQTGYDPASRTRANHTLVSALLALWDLVPEERFGQFVMNLSREPGGFADTWEWKHGAWLERVNTRYAEILEARDAAK